jgi:hypothetical protein
MILHNNACLVSPDMLPYAAYGTAGQRVPQLALKAASKEHLQLEASIADSIAGKLFQ